MEEDVYIKLGQHGVATEIYWSYDVESIGENLIFSFSSRPFIRQIRVHSSPGYYPYVDQNLTKGNKIIVSPGQWLEGYVDGRLSHLIDADNR